MGDERRSRRPPLPWPLKIEFVVWYALIGWTAYLDITTEGGRRSAGVLALPLIVVATITIAQTQEWTRDRVLGLSLLVALGIVFQLLQLTDLLGVRS